LSLPAEVRETIRQARDEHARATMKTDTIGRTGFTGVRHMTIAQACLEQADGDPLLALSFAADLAAKYGDARGRGTRHWQR
jgi:hypothetical protein